VPAGCTAELSYKGQQFLTTLFERFDKDRDGALCPAEVDDLFSTCPAPLWGPDVHRTVPTNSEVLYFMPTSLHQDESVKV
jgi:Ras family protein T1